MPEHPVEFAEDLDRLRCTTPGCPCTTRSSEIYLHPRCHPRAPTWSSYRAGVMSVWCCQCRKLVTAVAVAQRAEAAP